MNAVLGLLPLEHGTIRLNGRDIATLPIERRGLGYLPQQLGLFPHMSVRDNITYSARARGLPTAQFRTLVDRLVEATGIGNLLERHPGELSGGERQRVGLVRALASQPDIVLLDEPFTALNEALRHELWWLLHDLRREQNLPILLITHDLTEAYFLADRVSILLDGRICQQGDKEIVYRRPSTPEVARFLGVNNLWPGTVIGQEADRLIIDCPSLGTILRVPAGDRQPASGTPVVVGILAEDIMLRDAAHPPRADEYLFPVSVQLVDLGASQVVHGRHAATGATIELTVARRTARRFGLRGENEIITVGFPETSLFWVSNEKARV